MSGYIYALSRRWVPVSCCLLIHDALAYTRQATVAEPLDYNLSADRAHFAMSGRSLGRSHSTTLRIVGSVVHMSAFSEARTLASLEHLVAVLSLPLHLLIGFDKLLGGHKVLGFAPTLDHHSLLIDSFTLLHPLLALMVERSACADFSHAGADLLRRSFAHSLHDVMMLYFVPGWTPTSPPP